MPWSVERVGSALHVSIEHPMEGEWEPLLDAINAALDPRPKGVHLPSHVEGGTTSDAEMLKILWQTLGQLDLVLLPPASDQA